MPVLMHGMARTSEVSIQAILHVNYIASDKGLIVAYSNANQIYAALVGGGDDLDNFGGRSGLAAMGRARYP